ncbi:MAG: Omp28-related outer membrane protein [Bacteroidota bacterium]
MSKLSHTGAVASLCCLPAIWILFLAGCNTNPPVTPENPIPGTGRILVTANVSDARIFLDGTETGRLTPDTLTASVGAHLVGLQKDGFLSDAQTVRVGSDSLTEAAFTLAQAEQRVVLIEDFSNVSCNPCVASNLILEALVSGTYGRSKVAVVKYATNFPSPSDPFYVANRPDCDSRMSYYQILAAPTTIVDGVDRPTSTDSSAIKASIDAALLQPARFKISVRDSVVGGIYNIAVSVETIDTTGLDYQNLLLHTVITETEITFPSPPGSNGETRFTDVMRAMLPSNTGEPLRPQNVGGTEQYSRTIPVNQGWNTDHLHTVAFIQHAQTRVVYQSGSTFE